VPGLDGVNQLVAAHRIAPKLRAARSVWAVTTVASHGYAAALSGRRYGVWCGTSLADEWAARRPGLPASRRVALSVSARTLRKLERETLQRATRVYATSPASRAAVAEAGGLDPQHVGLLPIPVDTARLSPGPDTAWRDGLERPTLVFVGRGDDPRKNLPLLLEAFALLRRQVPAVRLVLAGPGTTALAAPGVEPAGEVSDVADVLRKATIFVLPSLQEGFGIVAAEALACGVPVVTTPSGGPEDLVRGSGGGRVLEGFTAAELAATLEELIDDPATLMAMRAAGRAYVEREHAPSHFRELLEAALDAVDRE
jgi:phosphatidylinositol alpha-mannosyltransferase